MDTDTPAQVAPSPTLRSTIGPIALGELYPSRNNPRQIVDGDPSIAELAQSIATMGLLQPIVVRWRPIDDVDLKPEYEILAGHRRYAAAKLAKLESLDCRILEDCDDRTALEITVVENLQRQDLQPLEEAHGVAALLDGGWDVADIASHLGKSERWVYLRAKLRDLSPAWRKALANPKSEAAVRQISAGALELIARHGEVEQDELLKDLLDDPWIAEDYTISDWLRYLDERFLHTLKGVKWDLDDANLVPAAGACSACTKRSSCQQQLFAIAKGGDRCLDTTCWKGKHAAWLAQREAELKAKHPELQRAATTYTAAQELKVPEIAKYSGDLTPAKKTDPKAQPVMAVDGSQAGQVVWVVPNGTAKGKSTSAKSKASLSPAAKRKLSHERWMGSRAKASLRHLRVWLGNQGMEKHRVIPQGANCSLLVLLSTAFESLSASGTFDHGFEVKTYEKLRSMETSRLDATVWEQIAQAWEKTLPGDNYDLPAHAAAWGIASELARHIGLEATIEKIQDTVRAEVPVPKLLLPFFDEWGATLADAPTDTKAKPKKVTAAKSETQPAAKAKAKASPKEKATTVVIKKPKAAKAKKKRGQG